MEPHPIRNSYRADLRRLDQGGGGRALLHPIPGRQHLRTVQHRDGPAEPEPAGDRPRDAALQPGGQRRHARAGGDRRRARFRHSPDAARRQHERSHRGPEHHHAGQLWPRRELAGGAPRVRVDEELFIDDVSGTAAGLKTNAVSARPGDNLLTSGGVNGVSVLGAGLAVAGIARATAQVTTPVLATDVPCRA